MNSVQASSGEIVFFFAAIVLFFGTLLLKVVPRTLRGHAQFDLALQVFIATVGTLLAVGWSAVVLALLGHYALGWTALLVTGIGIALALYARRTQAGANTIDRGDWHELGLALLLILAALLYARPHEYVLGGSDAGSYINTAAATARTGSYLQASEWNRFLSEHADVTMRTQPPQMRTRHLQFVGWYFDDSDPSLVRPQFFPFHPVLLSVAMSLGGVAAGFWVTPLAAVLSIAALYFLARQLFGKAVALLAALLLTITSTQIFFARYPTTEPLTLLLLFAGFLAFQILWDDADAAPTWGLFGGAALGAALLTRIDLPLVVAAVLAVLALRGWLRRWSRAWSAFALTFLFFLVQLLFVGWLFTGPYVWNTYYAVFSLASRSVWLDAAVAVGVAVLLLAAVLLGPHRFEAQLRRIEASSAMRWSLAIFLIALSAYAYFLRPVLEPARMSVSWPGGAQFPILNGQNWVRLGWYLTPLGIGLATAGIALIVVRERLARLTIVVGIGVLTTFQYIYNILNTPYHIYAMRRYVPIVIPMLWMFAAYAVVALPKLSKRWMTYSLRGAFILALVGGLIHQDRYVAPARDFAGSLQQLIELQQQLHPEAILLIAEPGAALFADAFGAPLQAMFDHPIATVRTMAPGRTGEDTANQDDAAEMEEQRMRIVEFLDELLAVAVAQNRPLQLLAVEPISPDVRDHVKLQPEGAYDFTTQMLMNTFDGFPSVTQTVHYGIEIYDVFSSEPGRSAASVEAASVEAVSAEIEVVEIEGVEVDVGSIDAAYLDGGFHAKEHMPGSPTMRWTEDVARLTVPLPQPKDNQDAPAWEIQVRAMIYRPADIAPAPVVVSVNGREVGSFVPGEEWSTYVLPVADAIAPTTDSAQIEFVTTAFVPAEIGVNNDRRSLGFLVDWIKILPAQSPR